MKTIALTLTTLILSACASQHFYEVKNTSWEQNLTAYKGQSFDAVKADLGKPETQYERENVKTYIWRLRTPDSHNVPARTKDWRPSRVSNAVVSANSGFVTCTVKADTVNNIVQNIWSEGTVGGCAYVTNPKNNVKTLTGLQ